MSDEVRETFYLNHDLQNGFRSHECLSKLAYDLKNTSSAQITIDLTGVNFIASNLFSVLGCILYEFTRRHPEPKALFIHGINAPISETIQKTDFVSISV